MINIYHLNVQKIIIHVHNYLMGIKDLDLLVKYYNIHHYIQMINY